MVYYGGHVM